MLMAFLARLGLTGRVAKLLGIAIPLGLVALAVGFLWLRGDHYRAKADKWHEATLKWEAANDMATAWAKAEAARKDKSGKDAKGNADAAFTLHKAAGEKLASDYIARNRCLRREAGGSGQQPADLSGAGPIAGKPESAGSDAELVGVTDSDLAICTANTLRLGNAVGWADDAKARGLAE